MSSLDASLVSVWEKDHDGATSDNAILLLKMFTDAGSPESLSIGERDRLVTDIRKALFGSKIKGFDTCPKCKVDLVFDIDLNDLDFRSSSEKFICYDEGVRAEMRTVTSQDILDLKGMDTARRCEALLQKCLISVNGNTSADISNISPNHSSKIQDMIEERDSNSLIHANQVCASCGNNWSVVLDIVSLLVEDINVYVNQRLSEVCQLAKLSGWTETEILAMTDKKREFYLEQMNE